MDLEPTWMTDLIMKVQHVYQHRSDHLQTLSDFTRDMPILSDDEMHKLFTACQSLGSYRFLAMAAIHYGKVEEVFTQELCHSLDVKFWDKLYTFLASRFWWSTVKQLLFLCPDGHFETLLRVLARSVRLNDEEKDVFGMLVERCSGSRVVWLKDALNVVTAGGNFQQFQILMSTDDKDTRQAIVEGFSEVPYLTKLIYHACRIRHFVGVSQRVTAYNHCLSLACEAGTFSALVTLKSTGFHDEAFNSVLGIAVVCNQPDLVRVLHSVGASTNSEIFRLSLHRLLEKRSNAGEGLVQSSLNSFPCPDDAGAAREIRDFLRHKASQPCSLLRLSLLEVSKHVGWGHCRQATVNRLGIPNNLNDLLMFKDNKSLLKG